MKGQQGHPCLTLLVIREIHIKSTKRYRHMPVQIAITADRFEMEPFVHCSWWIENWYDHCEKQHGGSPKKLKKIKSPYDPAVLVLSISKGNENMNPK